MKNSIKKTMAIITLAAVVCLNACSGDETKETTTAVPDNTVTTVQNTESLARVVEVPYEDEYKAVFTFDEKGLLVSSENCPWGDDNTYYKYDEQNRITEIQHALSDGTIDEGCERKVYSYDENGKLKNLTIYMGPKEKLVRFRAFEFVYDDKGNMTKETLYAGGNNKVMDTTDYEYDENGRLIKEICDSYGTKSEITYKYNENGDISETVETYNSTVYENSYVYSYDENGNPAKRSATYVTKELDDSGNVITETSTSEETLYAYKNGILLEESAEGNVEYEYFDNNRIVAVYCGGKEDPGEINIEAVPEVMGNFKDLPY